MDFKTARIEVIKEYSRVKGIPFNVPRNVRAAKNLLIHVGFEVDAAKLLIRDVAKFANDKNLDWTLETVVSLSERAKAEANKNRPTFSWGETFKM
jgi:hypothetical protein